jgi:hypothetical protein
MASYRGNRRLRQALSGAASVGAAPSVRPAAPASAAARVSLG